MWYFFEQKNKWVVYDIGFAAKNQWNGTGFPGNWEQAWKGTARPFASTDSPLHPGVCQSRLRSFWGPLSHRNNIYYSHISQ